MPADTAITQEELNSLLASLRGAEDTIRSRRREGVPGAVHEARVHDFARSEALPRSITQMLETIHATFARSMAARVSSYLRTPVQVSLLSVDQLTHDQFIRSVPEPTVIALFTIAPLPGQAILELNPVIAFWMIDRLLGGSGDILKEPRPLTYLERAVMQGPVLKILAELNSAWQGRIPATPALAEIVHSAAATEVAKPTDAVVAASFEVNVGSLTGMASISIPVISLKLGQVKASTAYRSGDSRQGLGTVGIAEPRESLAAAIFQIPVDCTVCLGVVGITTGELLQLQVGDVICLDRQLSEPFDLLIGSVPKYLCRPFVVGDKLAVEILGEAA